MTDKREEVERIEELETQLARERELLGEAIGYLRIGAFRPSVGVMINDLLEKIGTNE